MNDPSSSKLPELKTVTRATPAQSCPPDRKTQLPLFDGNVDQDSIVIVRPERCLPFPGAPRAGTAYVDARDGELAADVLVRGVLEPIILWHNDGADRVISGNRRRAVVMHLQEMGHEIKLPARRLQLDPLTAAATAQAFNSGRERPTAMQQARSLAWVVETIEQNRAAVAKTFAMSEAKVSRLLTLASLPDWLLACATDADTLSENFAAKIQNALGDPEKRRDLKLRARQLVTANSTLSGAALAHYLLTGKEKTEAEEIFCKELNCPVGYIMRDHRGSITLKVNHSAIREAKDMSVIGRTIMAALRTSLAF